MLKPILSDLFKDHLPLSVKPVSKNPSKKDEKTMFSGLKLAKIRDNFELFPRYKFDTYTPS